jgi:hypothetical protein
MLEVYAHREARSMKTDLCRSLLRVRDRSRQTWGRPQAMSFIALMFRRV